VARALVCAREAGTEVPTGTINRAPRQVNEIFLVARGHSMLFVQIKSRLEQRRPRYESKNIRKVENLHVFLWLLKNLSWCGLWRLLGMSMALPALFIAVLDRMAYAQSRVGMRTQRRGVLLDLRQHHLDDGEFYFNDHSRKLASGFFYCGMVLLISYYSYETHAAPQTTRLITVEPS
jgi:hypothetical protein